MPIFDGMKPNLVRCAVDYPAFQATTRHPHRESKNMMIPPIGSLRTRRTSELRRKNHQRLIQQAPLVQIF